jgi:hypothetical protein
VFAHAEIIWPSVEVRLGRPTEVGRERPQEAGATNREPNGIAEEFLGPLIPSIHYRLPLASLPRGVTVVPLRRGQKRVMDGPL